MASSPRSEPAAGTEPARPAEPTGPTGPIVLVGMMATGKTSLARQLAKRLGRRAYDSDAMIVARTGQTVAQLFEHGGEPAFRGLETTVLDEALAADPPGVVAAAGGVVLSPINRERLRRVSAEGGVVVWLTADPAVLARRVRPGDHRPLLSEDPAATLARLSAERAGWYAAVADATVDTGAVPFGAVVDEVLAAVDRAAGARP